MTTPIDASHFGRQLKRARRAARLNLSELSTLLNLPRRDIIRIEMGRQVMPAVPLYRLVYWGLRALMNRHQAI